MKTLRTAWKTPALVVLTATLACSGRTSGSAGSIGVAECDEYVARMNACMTKDARLKAMEPAFKSQQDAWKQMARSNTATVQSNCKTALQSLSANPSCR
jgi:hypothetical protein